MLLLLTTPWYKPLSNRAIATSRARVEGKCEPYHPKNELTEWNQLSLPAIVFGIALVVYLSEIER
jgi:hypothetical protein